jgi:hypothetical protein
MCELYKNLPEFYKGVYFISMTFVTLLINIY